MPSDRFSALLSPLRVRGKTMKTRFMYPVAQAHYIQGPEEYPADPVVQYYCSFARQGQSLIITQELTNLEQRQMSFGDQPHFALYDMDNPACQNYFTQLAYFIHFYGALCGFNLNYDNRLPYCINDPAKTTDIGAGGMGGPGGMPGGMPGGPGGMPGGMPGGPNEVPAEAQRSGFSGGKDEQGSGRSFQQSPQAGNEAERTLRGHGGPGNNSNKVYLDEEHMVEYINYMCKKTLAYQSFGYDAVHLEMAREFLMAKFLDPAQNHRDDEYGGSFENRIRFPVRLCKALREAVGENFIISTNAPSISLTEDRGRNALTISEAIEFMKAIEPYVDIVKLQNGNRGEDGVASMEGYELAKLLKAGGTKIKIAVNNPAMDLDLINRFVKEGVADVIASARMFIANDKLDEILREGDADELNHCLGCSVCRGQSQEEDWMSHCTINPKLGMEHRLKEHMTAPGAPKTIAVIGGGPAGMKCAVYLKDRGHNPVVFEASDHLGGLIRLSDYLPSKVNYTEFLDALEKQVRNRGIEIRLNTRATPDSIRAEGFDVVIAATGAHAKASAIPGAAEYASKWTTVNVYGNADKIGRRVVVIGGTTGPCEAATYLQANGHECTVLSRSTKFCRDAAWHHVTAASRPLYQSGATLLPGVRTTRIEEGKVYYLDHQGVEQCIPCDDVIAAAGLESNWEEAQSFYGAAPEYYAIGDCREAGNLRTAIADAFALAMRL